MQGSPNVSIALWPRPTTKSFICYAVVALSVLQILFQLTGFFNVPAGNLLRTHQYWIGGLNLLFGLYGWYIVKTFKRIDLNAANIRFSDRDVTQIREAFVQYSAVKEEADIVNAYKTSFSKRNQILDSAGHIFLAWMAFYAANLLKNTFIEESKQPYLDEWAAYHYFFDTLENLANNWVGLFAFIFYLHIGTVSNIHRQKIRIAKKVVVAISLLNLFLLCLQSLDPLFVNIIFKLLGSIVNGVILSMLFFRLCNPVIRPWRGYPYIFSLYVVLQPLIALTLTEALILRMPPHVKTASARQSVESMAASYGTLIPAGTDSVVIEKGRAWISNAGNRENLAECLQYGDLDSASLRRALMLTPLHFAAVPLSRFFQQHQRMNPVQMENVTTFSIMRRWALLAGKSFFLIFLIWAIERRRFIKHFMHLADKQVDMREKAFEDNRDGLPFLGE
jgi:hypothetical protein